METLGTLLTNPVNGLGNSGVYILTAKLDKTEVYEVVPCKQKGKNVEIYGSLAKSSHPFDAVMSKKTKGTMVDASKGLRVVTTAPG